MSANGKNGSDPPSPAEAEREITRTRGQLDLTLDALEQRLAARHLVGKGFDMFRDNFGSYEELSQKGLDIMRANPIPVALIGLGTAWLIAANTTPEEQFAAAGRRLGGIANDLGARAGELASGIADKVGLGDSRGSDRALGHTGNPVVDETGRGRSDGWLHQMAGMTQEALRSARDTGGEMLDRTGASRIPDQLSETYERNPLMLGVVAAMAGALLGALLPLSRTESRLLGDADLQRKAGEAGEEALARVRDAAARTLHTAADAVGGATDGMTRG